MKQLTERNQAGENVPGRARRAWSALSYGARAWLVVMLAWTLIGAAGIAGALPGTDQADAGGRTAGEIEHGCPPGTDAGYGVYEDCSPVLVPCERPDHATRVMFSLVLYLVDGADIRAFWSLVGAWADQCNQADQHGGALPASVSPGR